MTCANLMTILRVLMVFLAIIMMFTGNPAYALSSAFLILFAIILDGLDGYVARKYNEASKLGSVIDILGDRIVENLVWVAFAMLGWVAPWIPFVVLTRGILTDGLRSIALADGYTAFGKDTMMQNKFLAFLTASRFMRGLYGFAKTVAFVLVILAYIPNIEELNLMTVDQYVQYVKILPTFRLITDIFVYFAVALCVIRGIPVIIESKRFFENENKEV
ncbi:CDP-alcohol phosphatidyltransferase family protein [bacterium]|nr:CDP-alcohol phosphatidyltransferase family protein [bacterium]